MITLNDCRISRRGKAAKGTVWVKTFGIPVNTKDDKGITKKWNYIPLLGLPTEEIIEAVKAIGDVNLALLLGADLIAKSGGIKSQSENALIVAELMRRNLAVDEAEAKSVAQAMRDTRSNMLKLDMDVPSVEYLMEKRKAVVLKMIENKTWTGGIPDSYVAPDNSDDESDDLSDVPDEDYQDEETETV